MKISKMVLISAAFIAAAGCAGLDKMGAKMDMAEQHMGSDATFYYEGKLKSVHQIGPMTSLQFADGETIDVSKAPAGLSAGDIVRVYQTEKGDQAHLWRSAAKEVPSAEENALAPVVTPPQ